MAAKVNVKFVVMLGAALTLVLAGMAAVFFFVLKKSGQDWADRGEAHMAAQEYEEADQAFAFAVAHDRTNVAWLKQWIDAMEHRVIDNEVDFEDRFVKDYSNAVRQVAHMGRTSDLESHIRYLDMKADQLLGESRAVAWRFLLTEARASQQFFEAGGSAPIPGQTTPEAWHALYKYSGLALGVLYSLNMTESEDEVLQAERDLKLALAADPTDSEAGLELAQFYAVMSERRRTAPPVDLAEAERLLRESRQIVVSLAERDPEDPDVAIGLLQMDVSAARREFIARLAGRAATPDQIREVTAPFQPRLDAVAELLLRKAGAEIETVTLSRFSALENMSAPDTRGTRTARVLEAILAAHPEHLQAIIMLAEVQGTGQNRAQGVATLQRLIDLPNKPLGMEGYRLFRLRPIARELQAEFTLDQFDEAPETDRPALLTQAQGYREALSKEVPADSPALLKLDARMAFLRRDWVRAEELLLAVNQRTGGSDDDVLWWMAQTAQQLQKLGVARQMLNTLYEKSPDNPRIVMALAAIEKDLRNQERAEGLANRLLELRPGDQQIAEFVAMIRGEGDAIREALDRYQETLVGGAGVLPDADAAMRRLNEDFAANASHPALGLTLLRAHLDRGDLESAQTVVATVRAAYPDDADFRRFEAALTRGDIVAVLIDLINTTEGRSEFEKAMLRRMVYLQRGDTANATRELAAAAAIEPDNPMLVEAQFLEAIAANDPAAVTRLAAKAKQLNLDGQNGDTFTVRVMMFENKHREAVTLLESLVTRSPNDGLLWRLLGMERAQIGRLDEAVSAYRRTLEIRPNDVQSAKELMGLLGARGQFQQALQVARDTEVFGRGDLDFLNRLWILEARAGDSQVALTGREALRARDKNQPWNNALLAELYMDKARFADARALIDELRAGQDHLDFVALDARWHADQGNFEGARQAYITYIGSLPAGSVGSEPFIAMATFMQSREQLSLAAAALESGRVEQNPQTMDCDRMLGDILSMAQRLSDAVDAYKRVVDAGADTPEHTYRKRMVENLISLHRFDEAQAAMAAMRDVAATDRNVMLLSAELARGRGNRAEALRTLDEAVRLFPEDPVSYFQRAQVLQEDETRLQDALADYDSAIRKAPRFWQALRNRSGIYRRMDPPRIEDAVNDLRAGVLAAGTDGDAVAQLLGELMNLRRTQEATTAADEAVASRPTDVAFLQRIGSIFAGRGEWTVAARYYKQAFDLRQEADIGQRYIECLLSQNPPQLRIAEDALNTLGPKVLDNPGLLAAGASLHVRRNRLSDAEREATRAFDLVSGNSDHLLLWHRTMQRAFNDPTAYQAYLRRLAAAKQTTALRDWPVLFLAASQATVENTREAAKEQLVRLANQGQPVEVRQNAMRTIGTTLYGQGQYEEAARLWTQAVEMFPQDWEVNNNLAYVLTEYLGRAEDALPHALKAVEFQPRSPSVNDTVGWVYFKNGNTDKALLYLMQAARLSRDAAEQSVTIRHLIEVHLSQGDKANALDRLSYLNRLIAESPWLDASIRTEATELEARINSLP